VIVKPRPLILTHSFKLEFHSFIWKLYKPLSRASTKVVLTVEEHSDCAAEVDVIPREVRKIAQAIATV